MLRLDRPLVLASASPRRRALLTQLGLEHTVHPSRIDEVWPGGPPGDAVALLAQQKAQAVAPSHPDAIVIGADTVVVHEGDVLGKPADADEAARTLRRLSGHTHDVYSGLAVEHPGESVVSHVRTRVTFAELHDDEIAAYVAGGSPLDKAGAYGIQDDWGAAFVASIDGDYYNVVGLPIRRLYEILTRLA